MSSPALLRPVPDIAARGACALAEISSAADFRAQPTRDTFGDIPGAGVMALIVTRSTFHRLVVFEAVGVAAPRRSADVIPRARRRVDIAEDAAQNPILLFGHSTLLGQIRLASVVPTRRRPRQSSTARLAEHAGRASPRRATLRRRSTPGQYSRAACTGVRRRTPR